MTKATTAIAMTTTGTVKTSEKKVKMDAKVRTSTSARSSTSTADDDDTRDDANSTHAAASAAPRATSSSSSAMRWHGVQPPLHPTLLATIEEDFQFAHMTPVQAATIPAFCTHKDVLVQACTGSGKTLAFVLPIFAMLLRLTSPLRTHEVGALVLSPTRELAIQIESVLRPFAARLPQFRVALLIGGTDHERNERELVERGAHIIVATPGRLEHTMATLKLLDFRRLEVLVLDEADRLLDLGFQAQVTNILRKLPKQRRTGLFSATQTTAVQELARAGLRNPVKIDVRVQFKGSSTAAASASSASSSSSSSSPTQSAQSAQSTSSSTQPSSLFPGATGTAAGSTQITPTTLENHYAIVPFEHKLPALLHLFAQHTHHKFIVFFLSCASVDYFATLLEQLPCMQSTGLQVEALHGQMPQHKRTASYARFCELSTGVLVCTDVAARGIDIPDVDWIVQYDAPQDPSFFVHRIGRTARMGRRGQALLLLAPEEDTFVPFLRRKQVPIEEYPQTDELVRAASAGGASTTTTTSASSTPNKTSKLVPLPHLTPVLQVVQTLALHDRAVMEKGQRAFVSYVRAYKEHQLHLIFVFAQMPWARVAQGFGLLYFPKLPDLKHLNIVYQGHPVKPSDIVFKDKKREQRRQAEITAQAAKREEDKNAREREIVERRKQAKTREQARRDAEYRRNQLRKRPHQAIRAEWEELQAEARALKKLKSGRMSEKKYTSLLMSSTPMSAASRKRTSHEDDDDDDDDDD